MLKKGIRVVMGIRERRPIRELPDGATIRKITMAEGCLGTVLLRFPDRIESWYLEDCGEYWKPGFCRKSVLLK